MSKEKEDELRDPTSDNIQVSRSDSIQASASEMSPAREEVSETAPKRKRGRPLKQQSVGDQQAPKRPRGRPPKPKPVDGKPEVKRLQGRPRKVVQDAPAVDTINVAGDAT